MVNLKLPKPEKIGNYIDIRDYFEPEYWEYDNYDEKYYIEFNKPIMRTHVPVYSDSAYKAIEQFREEAIQKYKEWLRNKPSFIDIEFT